jgi:hypothetical protein
MASEFGFSQTGHGFSFDNYGGIYLLANNPAHSVQSKHRWHINGLSYNSLNYTETGPIDLFAFQEAPNGLIDIAFTPEMVPESGFYDTQMERDWLLPSVLYTINENLAASVLIRSRNIANYTQYNGAFFAGLTSGFTSNIEAADPANFSSASHSWSELGLNFAAGFNLGEYNYVKIGFTGKLLLGQGALFLEGEDIVTSYDENTERLTLSGTIRNVNTYENSSPTTAETTNIFAYPFANFTASTSSGTHFGGDVGLVYERRPSATNRVGRDGSVNTVNLYKVKIAAAITDLGSITYGDKDSPDADQKIVRNSYTAQNANLSNSDIVNNGLLPTLATTENVQTAQPRGEVNFALPTAFNINIDYLLFNDKNLYVNANYVHPIRTTEEPFTNQRIQLATLTPRWETQQWSAYLPLSYGTDAGFDLGIGFRWRYFTIGTAALMGFIKDDNTKKLGHIYFGISCPLFEEF